MPPTPALPRTLTREEARTRAGLLTVTSYAVELDLTGLVDGTAFTSTCEVRFGCRQPGATSFLELDGELLRLERGGVEVQPVVRGNRLELADLAAEEVVRVTARCATTRTGEGLHRMVDRADGEVYVYANAFLDDAQRIFACFDQPDLKATVQLTVRAPAAWTVLANSRGTTVDGRTVFAPTERLSTYLVTLAAGPWHGAQRVHDGIELGVWCRRSLAPHLDADELFTVTAACLDVQQEVFGRRYPFGDTYDQVFVPEFNAGAMENPGMVTFSDDSYVFRSRTTQGRRRQRAEVVAHEMAHMWFGDLVTMRWWDDLWLNESFAELLGHHTVDLCQRRGTLPWEGTWADFCLGRKAWGYRADQLPTTHPVAGDVPDNRSALLNFDGISYAKGASRAAPAVGLARRGRVLRRRTALPRRARLGQHRARRPARGARGGQRPGPAGLGAGVAAHAGRPGAAGRRRPAPPGGRRAAAAAGRRREVRRGRGRCPPPGRAGRGRPSPATRRRWTSRPAACCCPTTATSPSPRCGSTRARSRSRSPAPATWSTRSPARWCWGALYDTTRDGELPAAAFVDAVVAGVAAERDPDLVRPCSARPGTPR